MKLDQLMEEKKELVRKKKY